MIVTALGVMPARVDQSRQDRAGRRRGGRGVELLRSRADGGRPSVVGVASRGPAALRVPGPRIAAHAPLHVPRPRRHPPGSGRGRHASGPLAGADVAAALGGAVPRRDGDPVPLEGLELLAPLAPGKLHRDRPELPRPRGRDRRRAADPAAAVRQAPLVGDGPAGRHRAPRLHGRARLRGRAGRGHRPPRRDVAEARRPGRTCSATR